MEYVAAAQLRNERTSYILFAEILPNVMGPVMVEFTVRLGYAIFTVATLSFLGFGIQPPSPDWGLQVFEHYGLISGGYWWPVLFPALAIAILVVGRQPDRRRHSEGVRAMTSAPVATAHALELEDVEVEYRVRGEWKRVLRGISLHIAEGESYGFVGESGCGKSTAAFAALRYLPAQRAREQGQHSAWRARTCSP